MTYATVVLFLALSCPDNQTGEMLKRCALSATKQTPGTGKRQDSTIVQISETDAEKIERLEREINEAERVQEQRKKSLETDKAKLNDLSRRAGEIEDEINSQPAPAPSNNLCEYDYEAQALICD